MGEYTYEFCFFGGTKQIPNKGGQTVGLGKYSKFDKSGKLSEESDEYFESMIYDKGQKCWNGPERSTLVSTKFVGCCLGNRSLEWKRKSTHKFISSDMHLTFSSLCSPFFRSTWSVIRRMLF